MGTRGLVGTSRGPHVGDRQLTSPCRAGALAQSSPGPVGPAQPCSARLRANGLAGGASWRRGVGGGVRNRLGENPRFVPQPWWLAPRVPQRASGPV